MKKKKVTKYKKPDSPYWWLKWREGGKPKYQKTEMAQEVKSGTPLKF
jgi:hypothetical protein